MKISYKIIFRACDKVVSVHKDKRPFGLTKKQTIKLSFYSLYKSLYKQEREIIVIGDDLSIDMLNFFAKFADVHVVNEKYGSASKSLIKQIEMAIDSLSDDWVYLCEDDYLHQSCAFNWISDFISKKEEYLRTSGKKKNYLNRLVGNIAKRDLILHLPDYPDRYLPEWKRHSYIFLSKYCHWRQISNTTHSILLSQKTLKKFYKPIMQSAIQHSDSKLSENVYLKIFSRLKAICISPIPGLSSHLTEGVMTPLVDWSEISKKYIIEMKSLGFWND